jgi:hypothetical protein
MGREDAFRRHEGAWGGRKGAERGDGGGGGGGAGVNAAAASGRGGGEPACGGREVARREGRGRGRWSNGNETWREGAERIVGVKLKSPGGKAAKRVAFEFRHVEVCNLCLQLTQNIAAKVEMSLGLKEHLNCVKDVL